MLRFYVPRARLICMDDHDFTDRHSGQLEELASKIAPLRLALREILAARNLSAATATELGRSLKLSKNLAWSLHRFASTDGSDLSALLTAMPGVRGWDSVCGALRECGHDRDTVNRLVASISKCARLMSELGSSRKLLAAKAASRRTNTTPSREIVALRKAAMHARELAIGVSVTVDLGCYLVAPAQQRGMVGVAAVRMFDRLVQHRLRAPWPLYLSMQSWSQDTASAGAFHALTSDDASEPLIQDLSTSGVLGNEITVAQQRNARNREFDFVGHVTSRAQPVCVCFGEVAPVLGSMHCNSNDTHAELGRPLELPTSLLVFDFCMHRDVLRGDEPKLRMFSSPDATYSHRSFRERNELPPEAPLLKGHERDGDEELATMLAVELGDSAATATRVCNTYAALRTRAATALSTALADYTRYRVTVVHPTMPSTLLVSWQLA